MRPRYRGACGSSGFILFANGPDVVLTECEVRRELKAWKRYDGRHSGMPPIAPDLVLAIEAIVQVGPPMEIGAGPHGVRRIVPILGGTFGGSGFKGRVLGGGADWQIVRADGFSELDSRYTLETDAGDLVYVQNRGIRHSAPDVMQQLLAGERVAASKVYFATTPAFETSAPALQWLMRSIFVGTGERQPLTVIMRFWRVSTAINRPRKHDDMKPRR